MKVRLIKNEIGEVFVSKNKRLNIGDVIEVPKDRAIDLVKRGKFELVKETKQSTDENVKGVR